MDSAAQSETTQYIDSFVTYILDFKKNVVFTSVMCLIIFLLSLSSGAFYYVYKSIINFISTRLPSSVNPGIIFFIIKILIFYSLFKLILNTLFDLIFIDRHSNEKYYCELKKTIDFISGKLAGLFFGLYAVFMFPVYLSSSMASIYTGLIESLIAALGPDSGVIKTESLKKTEVDIKKLQKLLNKEVANFYHVLKDQSNGKISTWFRDIFENIFIEQGRKSQSGGGKTLCECLKESRKSVKSSPSSKSVDNVGSSDFEENSNLIACQHSFSVTIYFIILGILYILLFILFPEGLGLRIGIFVIVTLLVMRCMFGELQFKLATRNIAIYNAFLNVIRSDAHENLLKQEHRDSRVFIGNFLSGFHPILKYIFGEPVKNGPTIQQAFSIEDIVKCVNLQCKEGDKVNALKKTLSNKEA